MKLSEVADAIQPLANPEFIFMSNKKREVQIEKLLPEGVRVKGIGYVKFGNLYTYRFKVVAGKMLLGAPIYDDVTLEFPFKVMPV